MKARTPIERMIDRACGFDPAISVPERRMLRVHCPKCKKSIVNEALDRDPPRAVRVSALCLECLAKECVNKDDAVYREDFYDAVGRMLLPDGL